MGTKAFKGECRDNYRQHRAGIVRSPAVEFRLKMIPHHQGAIDMAKVALQYGASTETKAMAEAIITAQEREIAEMKAWLEKNRK